jgi:hypothetical protein
MKAYNIFSRIQPSAFLIRKTVGARMQPSEVKSIHNLLSVTGSHATSTTNDAQPAELSMSRANEYNVAQLKYCEPRH